MINAPTDKNTPNDSNNLSGTGKSELTVGASQEIHAKTLIRVDKMFEPHIDNKLMLDLKSALIKLADEGRLCD